MFFCSSSASGNSFSLFCRPLPQISTHMVFYLIPCVYSPLFFTVRSWHFSSVYFQRLTVWMNSDNILLPYRTHLTITIEWCHSISCRAKGGEFVKTFLKKRRNLYLMMKKHKISGGTKARWGFIEKCNFDGSALGHISESAAK